MGEFTTHCRRKFWSGLGGENWGCGLLTHGHICLTAEVTLGGLCPRVPHGFSCYRGPNMNEGARGVLRYH